MATTAETETEDEKPAFSSTFKARRWPVRVSSHYESSVSPTDRSEHSWSIHSDGSLRAAGQPLSSPLVAPPARQPISMTACLYGYHLARRRVDGQVISGGAKSCSRPTSCQPWRPIEYAGGIDHKSVGRHHLTGCLLSAKRTRFTAHTLGFLTPG